MISYQPHHLIYFCSVFPFSLSFTLLGHSAFLFYLSISLSSCASGQVLHLTLPSFLHPFLLNLKQVAQSQQLGNLYQRLYPLTLMEDQWPIGNGYSCIPEGAKKLQILGSIVALQILPVQFYYLIVECWLNLV